MLSARCDDGGFTVCTAQFPFSSHLALCCTPAPLCPPQYLVAAAEQRRRFQVTGVLLDHAELGLSPPTSPRRLLQQQEAQRKQVRLSSPLPSGGTLALEC